MMGGREVRVKGWVKCGPTTNINVFMCSVFHMQVKFAMYEAEGAPTLYPEQIQKGTYIMQYCEHT
jgi:hypothetical protein